MCRKPTAKLLPCSPPKSQLYVTDTGVALRHWMLISHWKVGQKREGSNIRVYQEWKKHKETIKDQKLQHNQQISTNKSSPQINCTTYFVRCLLWQQMLSAGKPAVHRLPAHCQRYPHRSIIPVQEKKRLFSPCYADKMLRSKKLTVGFNKSSPTCINETKWCYQRAAANRGAETQSSLHTLHPSNAHILPLLSDPD